MTCSVDRLALLLHSGSSVDDTLCSCSAAPSQDTEPAGALCRGRSTPASARCLVINEEPWRCVAPPVLLATVALMLSSPAPGVAASSREPHGPRHPPRTNEVLHSEPNEESSRDNAAHRSAGSGPPPDSIHSGIGFALVFAHDWDEDRVGAVMRHPPDSMHAIATEYQTSDLRVAIESHVLFGKKDGAKVGPFVMVNSGFQAGRILESLGAGVMVGLPRAVGSDANDLNIGIGLVADRGVRRLPDPAVINSEGEPVVQEKVGFAVVVLFSVDLSRLANAAKALAN